MAVFKLQRGERCSAVGSRRPVSFTVGTMELAASETQTHCYLGR